MTALRHMMRERPFVATLIVAAALALRTLVPGGFMPTVDHGRMVVTICSGAADGPGRMAMTIPGLEHGPATGGGSAQGKCAFADLAQALDGATPETPITAAPLFADAAVSAYAPFAHARAESRLRPPLRGPPPLA